MTEDELKVIEARTKAAYEVSLEQEQRDDIFALLEEVLLLRAFAQEYIEDCEQEEERFRRLYQPFIQCTRPPASWYCTREHGHEGPCAALPRTT